MKIKKIGHCCLVVETQGKRVMTDPGSYTIDEQIKEKNIDIIIISHEHGDHYHLESLKKILENNPNAVVVTNKSVGKLLDEAGIAYKVLEEKSPTQVMGLELEAHDCRHEEIFEEIGQVENTAFFIDKRLFYPGDAYYNPSKQVEILALPVAGPWVKIPDAIRYAISIKPKVCFPVHDGGLKSPEGANRFISPVFSKIGIAFKTFEGGREEEF